ncbi:hypothetical protein DCO17_04525 [Polynucleobacter tropicus]|uniref:Lipoprotein n=1 Tax=Polynucleobacter tropicus TaxID=1743174 RepID=A0A6M9PWB3_9BURK|nr:hypothetical protein [Polynucleobacter tropicus]QKM64561.1 hypothetical protein DCO17_04525 [Polynucleobacter tropicus]
MKLSKMRLTWVPTVFLAAALTAGLSACGSVEQAAQDDCTSIGWQIGSKGYQDCYKARLYERKLDYSLPLGDKPSPSLL